MKKTIIALAAAAAAAGALAQSSVTLWGVVDLGVTRGIASGPGSANATMMTSGNNSTSKLGLKGVEDLGGGMSASFWLEGQLYANSGAAGRETPTGNQAINIVKQSGLNFSRRSTVSLAGHWGEVRLGRDFTPSLYNLTYFDPWYNVGVATSIVVIGPATGLNAGTAYGIVPAGQGTSGPVSRASNQVSYFTPNLGGLYGQLSHWFGNNPHNGAVNQDDGTGNGVRVGYQNKVWEAAAAWARTTYRATPVATTTGAPSGDFAAWNVAGSYDFGLVKLLATYARDERRSDVPARGRGWLLGAVAPVGPDEFRFSIGEYRINAGTALVPRTLQWGIGYVHNLSKRTALYATFARASNHDGAHWAVGGASVGATVLNSSSTGVDVGIRHNF